MKLSEINVGSIYAVVPSWTYSNREARDVNKVRENDVVKAELISKDKYMYEPSNRKDDPARFQKAPQGERSVGVLVKGTDNSGNPIYWTSRLADIVALYSDLEPKWSAEKSAQELREQEEKQKRAIVNTHKQNVNAEIERSRNSVATTAKELLGSNAKVEVGGRGYDLQYEGVVTISISDFQQLVEMAYQGKEVYA